MPRILFVAATSLELEPLRRQIAGARPGFAATFAVTGVGKASAALQTALAIGRSRPRLVMQVGCAGAFRGSGLSVGDVAIATGEVLGDEGVISPRGFIDLRQLSLPALAGKGSAPAIYNEVPLSPIARSTWQAVRRMSAGRFHVKQGLLATVSSGSGTTAAARRMEARWGALAESMEGAAAALSARALGLRMIEVRGISNAAGNRRRGDWDVPLACAHAAEVALVVATLEGRANQGGKRRAHR
ncbi:MAG TPA: futalosine hydrolase [Planctomycetota bacterium]|nr:futalosine hydrolase [Planctomycetota bacterium]